MTTQTPTRAAPRLETADNYARPGFNAHLARTGGQGALSPATSEVLGLLSALEAAP